MPLTSTIRTGINRLLRGFNLQLGTLTAERAELARLSALDAEGQFAKAVFPTLPSFRKCKPEQILPAVDRFREITDGFSLIRDGRYSFQNSYFSSPDAEVTYALVRELRPKLIIEVGSGNSTQLFREAIRDAEIASVLMSIDPRPRKSIDTVADKILKCRLEDVPVSEFESLRENDILFIDSSHEIRTGNDVIRLFSNILPRLAKGVLIHVHDIFLPYEYPAEWVLRNRWLWNEQYLVQALLQDSDAYDVLWPGHYLQRTLPTFARHFLQMPNRLASSLWLRKRT
jgi:hypothetical protein